MPRAELRDQIGMVLQDTWLFEGTIRDNIAYGRPGATEDEILEAARATYVDRFVHSLPDGYDTHIDEEGSNLSAGERQLVTIARAFLSDPELLILDEATSSVDTRTELLLQHAMAALRTDRTSFVIAHRLSTIRDADLILVMEDGAIVEQGNHDSLLLDDGAYARLYNAQFVAPEECGRRLSAPWGRDLFGHAPTSWRSPIPRPSPTACMVPQGCTSPAACAYAAASVRVCAPSFARMCDTWTLAVFGEMNSRAAIAQLVAPLATRQSTSRSRSVSEATFCSGEPNRGRIRRRRANLAHRLGRRRELHEQPAVPVLVDGEPAAHHVLAGRRRGRGVPGLAPRWSSGHRSPRKGRPGRPSGTAVRRWAWWRAGRCSCLPESGTAAPESSGSAP